MKTSFKDTLLQNQAALQKKDEKSPHYNFVQDSWLFHHKLQYLILSGLGNAEDFTPYVDQYSHKLQPSSPDYIPEEMDYFLLSHFQVPLLTENIQESGVHYFKENMVNMCFEILTHILTIQTKKEDKGKIERAILNFVLYGFYTELQEPEELNDQVTFLNISRLYTEHTDISFASNFYLLLDAMTTFFKTNHIEVVDSVYEKDLAYTEEVIMSYLNKAGNYIKRKGAADSLPVIILETLELYKTTILQDDPVKIKNFNDKVNKKMSKNNVFMAMLDKQKLEKNIFLVEKLPEHIKKKNKI